MVVGKAEEMEEVEEVEEMEEVGKSAACHEVDQSEHFMVLSQQSTVGKERMVGKRGSSEVVKALGTLVLQASLEDCLDCAVILSSPVNIVVLFQLRSHGHDGNYVTQ
jgi:hypothetical protein